MASLLPFYGLWTVFFVHIRPNYKDYKVYQGWGLQQSGPTDPPKENGRKFTPAAPVATKFRLGNTR